MVIVLTINDRNTAHSRCSLLAALAYAKHARWEGKEEYADEIEKEVNRCLDAVVQRCIGDRTELSGVKRKRRKP